MKKSTRELLRKYNSAYTRGAPLISDLEYDSLVSKLQLEFPDDAVFQLVGDEPSKSAHKYQHKVPMLSLQSVYNEEALEHWRHPEVTNYITEVKYDGISLSCEYQRGQLVTAATRGNGKQGSVVPLDHLEQCGIVKNIPSAAEDDLYVVHGELVMSHQQFDASFARQYATGRNAVAAQVNTEDDVIRGADFVAYGGSRRQDHWATLRQLRDQGFRVCSEMQRHSSWHSALHWVRSWDAARRAAFAYPMDGVVIKIDALEVREELGATRHHPRHSVAYKFAADSAATRVTGVEWGVGRHGSATPVVLLDPVLVQGSRITRATAHNYAYLARHRLAPGDPVEVEKAGDAIPHLLAAPCEPRDAQLLPLHCPCDKKTPLLLDEQRLELLCAESSCVPRRAASMEFSAKALGLSSIGPAVCRDLLEAGLASRGLWSLLESFDEEAASQLHRWGAKKASKIGASIRELRVSLPSVLLSLDIPGVGPAAASALALRYRSVAALRRATSEQMQEIHGIGPLLAQHVEAHFRAHPEVLPGALESATVSRGQAEGPLQGLNVCITGKLQGGPRRHLATRITEAGGAVSSSVTKKTSFLVAAREPTAAKVRKAEKLQIPVMTEQELLDKYFIG